jgi:hypothetical protein
VAFKDKVLDDEITEYEDRIWAAMDYAKENYTGMYA